MPEQSLGVVVAPLTIRSATYSVTPQVLELQPTAIRAPDSLAGQCLEHAWVTQYFAQPSNWDNSQMLGTPRQPNGLVGAMLKSLRHRCSHLPWLSNQALQSVGIDWFYPSDYDRAPHLRCHWQTHDQKPPRRALGRCCEGATCSEQKPQNEDRDATAKPLGSKPI